MTPVISWIESHVAGLTFADIGGIGLNSLNERISVAARAGAKTSTVIDYRRFGFPEWEVFFKTMKDKGVSDYQAIDFANLASSDFSQKVGKFDFVHCMGILYHAPSPMQMLENLSKITGKYLITNTVIVPEVIENEAGVLRFDGSLALFLPGLSEQDRRILDLYYQRLLNWPPNRFNVMAPRIDDPKALMPWLQTRAASDAHFWGDKGEMSFSPYWWLFTREAFRAALRIFGFAIQAEHSFKGHTLVVFCERS